MKMKIYVKVLALGCAFVLMMNLKKSDNSSSVYSQASFLGVNGKSKPTDIDAKLLYRLIKTEASLSKMIQHSYLSYKAKFIAVESKAKEDGRRETLMCLEKINEVTSHSKELSKIVVDISNQLIIASGGRDEKGVPVGFLDKNVVNRVLVGSGSGTQLGLQFELKLDEIAKAVNQCQKSIAPIVRGNPKKYTTLNLTESGNESPLSQKYAKLKEETEFLNLAFGEATLVEALITLKEKEAEVIHLEQELLTSVQETYGSNKMIFRKEFPVVVATSKSVVAGEKYKANLFLTTKLDSKDLTTKYYVNNKEVKGENGFGNVSFPVYWGGGTPLKGNPNVMRKTWKGKIEVSDNSGRVITTYHENFEYFVAKPKLNISTSNSNVLYQGCKNRINIGLSDDDLTYTAFGAKVVKSDNKGEVFLVPLKGVPSVSLNIKKGDKLFSVEKFKAYQVPTPRLIVYKEGRPVDLKGGLGSCPAKLVVKATINESVFMRNYSQDLACEPSAGTIQLVRGRRPIGGAVHIAKGGLFDLSSLIGSAKSGDRLLVDVRQVKRINFEGVAQEIKISGTDGIIVLPL